MVGMTQTTSRHRWTRAELDSLPDDGNRYEIIDGELLVSPAPRTRHQRASARLTALLLAACDAEPDRSLQALAAPFDVVLADDTVIQPDLLVAPTSAFTEKDLPSAPLLAVEILSPSTRLVDLNVKKDRLQRAGAAHYWVIDPDEPSITAWTLRDGRYVESGRAVGDATLHISAPLTLEITPTALLA